ncbi:hypothetical protein G5I_01984 [Acromyrmex echinatior]|uniref:Uncharacterized protein n=1 Tax=Acromyrmex echinatior TaxID=103372 RepID=F4W937_ACREC|nr:hypothetical protein G5I_01984 [Acromyrmex echinatior]
MCVNARGIFFAAANSYSGEQSCLSWPLESVGRLRSRGIYGARDETVVVERSAGRREDIESEKGDCWGRFKRRRARRELDEAATAATAVAAAAAVGGVPRVGVYVASAREESNNTEKRRDAIAIINCSIRSTIARVPKERTKSLLGDSENRLNRHELGRETEAGVPTTSTLPRWRTPLFARRGHPRERRVVPELCLVAEGIEYRGLLFRAWAIPLVVSLPGEHSTFGRGKTPKFVRRKRAKNEIARREREVHRLCRGKKEERGETGRSNPLFVGRSTTATASWALGNLRERSPSLQTLSYTRLYLRVPLDRVPPLLALPLPCGTCVPTRSSSSRPANKGSRYYTRVIRAVAGRAEGFNRGIRISRRFVIDPDRVSFCDAGTVRDNDDDDDDDDEEDDDEKGSDRGEDGR